MCCENEKLIAVLDEQERLLRFGSFTNEDALALGNFLVMKAKEEGLALAVAVRKPNGALLFHHLMEGTSLNNQNWMTRKFNTVRNWERSSLRQFMDWQVSGEDLNAHGLNSQEYVLCGGGFPIKMKSGEFAGVVTVSNLPHFRDHAFLVRALSAFLNVSCPQLPEDAELRFS